MEGDVFNSDTASLLEGQKVVADRAIIEDKIETLKSFCWCRSGIF